ncbi:NAD(P)-dependent oxidoreductase [Candidatus Woesearchaeota archaeon]|jgi:CDP-paratose synthetase|nr:NAD(P)-dependent oxidoreductase [Candidatus Woesearchaeota archaeon]
MVVVTGGTGFFGSHLIKGLLSNGYQIVLLKRSTSDLWRIDECISEIDLFNVDIFSLDVFYEKYPKIDACIHTATNYGGEDIDIGDIFQVNVSFPFALLSSLYKSGCKIFLNTDTFYTKSNSNNTYRDMGDYITSKWHFSKLGRDFSALVGIVFINVRLFHLYGPMDNNNKFTASIFNQLINNYDIDLTSGNQGRDFIYVEDAVEAFIEILKEKHVCSNIEYEVGTGNIVSIRDFTQMAQKLIGSKSNLFFGRKKIRVCEDKVSNIAADTYRLRKLGWFPKVSLEDGIKHCFDGVMRQHDVPKNKTTI